MKTYTPPSLVEYGSVALATADFGEESVNDTFFTPTGSEPGRGGSLDSCVTANDIRCL